MVIKNYLSKTTTAEAPKLAKKLILADPHFSMLHVFVFFHSNLSPSLYADEQFGSIK